MKKLLFSLLFLSACATENPLKDMRFKTVSSGDYTMASWYKITKPEQPVKMSNILTNHRIICYIPDLLRDTFIYLGRT